MYSHPDSLVFSSKVVGGQHITAMMLQINNEGIDQYIAESQLYFPHAWCTHA